MTILSYYRYISLVHYDISDFILHNKISMRIAYCENTWDCVSGAVTKQSSLCEKLQSALQNMYIQTHEIDKPNYKNSTIL